MLVPTGWTAFRLQPLCSEEGGEWMWAGLSMKKVVLRILAAREAAPTLTPALSPHSPVLSFLTLNKRLEG